MDWAPQKYLRRSQRRRTIRLWAKLAAVCGGQRISVQGLLSSVREVREMVGGAIQELKPLVNPNGWVSWESHGLRWGLWFNPAGYLAV